MPYSSSFDISAAGMSIERLRLDTAAMNIANVHASSGQPENVYRPQRVVASNAIANNNSLGSFANLLSAGQSSVVNSYAGPTAHGAYGVTQVDVVSDPVPPKKLYDPSHPQADDLGFVYVPNVDPVAEMLTIITATRSYEANVKAFNASKTMALRALEIGGR